MYSDKAKRIWLKNGIAALLILLVISLFRFLIGSYSRDLILESETAIEETIRRSALQCYVVEGIYPPNLAYLEENYGLQVNTDDFYIRYDAFASNLPPTVKVIAKHE